MEQDRKKIGKKKRRRGKREMGMAQKRELVPLVTVCVAWRGTEQIVPIEEFHFQNTPPPISQCFISASLHL